jgi:anti-anti-sigma factor
MSCPGSRHSNSICADASGFSICADALVSRGPVAGYELHIGVTMTKRFSGLEIDESAREGLHTLSLGGELDIASASALHGAISRMLDRASPGDAIVLDLSGLIFIDSTGLAEIILTSQLCERDGHGFALIQGPRAVQRIFELTGLVDALPFLDATTNVERSDSIASESARKPI